MLLTLTKLNLPIFFPLVFFAVDFLFVIHRALSAFLINVLKKTLCDLFPDS